MTDRAARPRPAGSAPRQVPRCRQSSVFVVNVASHGSLGHRDAVRVTQRVRVGPGHRAGRGPWLSGLSHHCRLLGSVWLCDITKGEACGWGVGRGWRRPQATRTWGARPTAGPPSEPWPAEGAPGPGALSRGCSSHGSLLPFGETRGLARGCGVPSPPAGGAPPPMLLWIASSLAVQPRPLGWGRLPGPLTPTRTNRSDLGGSAICWCRFRTTAVVHRR